MKFQPWERDPRIGKDLSRAIPDPNNQHPGGRIAPGVQAAIDLLEAEAKRWDARFGDPEATFAMTGEWSRRRDACELSAEFLRHKLRAFT